MLKDEDEDERDPMSNEEEDELRFHVRMLHQDGTPAAFIIATHEDLSDAFEDLSETQAACPKEKFVVIDTWSGDEQMVQTNAVARGAGLPARHVDRNN